MKLTGGEDLRVQKTIEGINRAFKEMISEMPYEDFTVKELCERARINKKTFYRYYPTMDHLMSEYQQDMSEEFLERTAGLTIPADLEQITREFISFSAVQGDAYDNIICSPAYGAVHKQMLDRTMAHAAPIEHEKPLEEGQRAVVMAFISQATLAVYRQWAVAGRRFSERQLEDMAVTLVCDGVNELFA